LNNFGSLREHEEKKNENQNKEIGKEDK